MGIRLKLGLISTIKHQLTYAPPWHCTRACQPRQQLALSILRRLGRLPVVRYAETGTSGPDSEGKDEHYLPSVLRAGILRHFVHQFVPPRSPSLGDAVLESHPRPGDLLGTPIIRAFLHRLLWLWLCLTHQITFRQDALSFLQACLFGTPSSNICSSQKPGQGSCPCALTWEARLPYSIRVHRPKGEFEVCLNIAL